MTPAEVAFRAWQTTMDGAVGLDWTQLSPREQDAWRDAATEAVREAGSKEHGRGNPYSIARTLIDEAINAARSGWADKSLSGREAALAHPILSGPSGERAG